MVVEIKAYESHGPNGEVRVDYSIDGRGYTFLVERIGDASLYSKFDSDGITLFQSLEKVRQGMLSAAGNSIKELISLETGESVETLKAEYTPVRINRNCPGCGSASLERAHATHEPGSGNVPTVPRYTCSSCGQECYHISDDYMARLVKGNNSLFSDEERTQLEKDPKGFIKELKEYTSRIFATRNIKRVI